MKQTKIFSMAFAGVYPYYVQKVEKKGRTREEVDTIICWLTGYNVQQLQQQIDRQVDFETFFQPGSENKPKRPFDYGCDMRLSGRRHYRSIDATDSISG